METVRIRIRIFVSNNRIRIRIKLKSRTRIRINVKIKIRIRIRIRIRRVWIPNTAHNPMLLLHEGIHHPAVVAQLSVLDKINLGRPVVGISDLLANELGSLAHVKDGSLHGVGPPCHPRPLLIDETVLHSLR
jgi:hypothetical protein